MKSCSYLVVIFFSLIAAISSVRLSGEPISVSFSAPMKPGDDEVFGLVATISVKNKRGEQSNVRLAIDSLTPNVWMIDSVCKTETCEKPAKINRVQELSDGILLQFIKGSAEGKLDKLDFDFGGGFEIKDKRVILMTHSWFPFLNENKIDGMMGIIRQNSSLEEKYQFKSFPERIMGKIKDENIDNPVYFILIAGISNPYMKFGDLTNNELKYKYKKDNPQYWINVYEPGKLILAMQGIKMVFYNENGKVKNTSTLIKPYEKGAYATFDFSSYYIYAPEGTNKYIKDLLKPSCENKDSLPDLIISFYSVDNRDRLTTVETIDISLTPDEYIKTYVESDEVNCELGIIDHNGPSGWSFGMMFMKPHIFTYDFQNDRVSFLRIKP